MRWHKVHACHAGVRKLADRHYSRQNPGSPRFMPPGRCLVLLSDDGRAVWGSSFPYAEFVLHEWAGAWICSIFRNESDCLSSELIVEAVAATRWRWPVPELGMVTFIDTSKVQPIKRRGMPLWGYCYLKAGFVHVGETKGGLLAYQLKPEDMPIASAPLGVQWTMAI